MKAIERKREKLQRAKERGERTLLLLDSGDYSLLNEQVLAEAFARAVDGSEGILEGIDSVYVHWYHLVVPVKLEDRRYPALPEFDENVLKQI